MEPESDPLLDLTDEQVERIRSVPHLADLEAREGGIRMSPDLLEAEALEAAVRKSAQTAEH